jgi:hypothetical protein
MSFRHAVTGAVAVLALSAAPALAHHDLGYTYKPSSTSVGAVFNSTSSADYGTNMGVSQVTHLAPGTLMAHADDATSPVSPTPIDGDQVGETATVGDLSIDGCGNPTTTPSKVYWQEPIGSGAPAGTVAELEVIAKPFTFFTITKRAFIVKTAAGYDFVVPDLPDESQCAGSSGSTTNTSYGFVKTASGTTTNRILQRHGSTTGTKTVAFEYTDTSGATHSDSATFSLR